MVPVKPQEERGVLGIVYLGGSGFRSCYLWEVEKRGDIDEEDMTFTVYPIN